MAYEDAPPETLTILHHAEALANVPAKRRVRFPARIRTADGLADIEVDEIDTSHGAFDYESMLPGDVDAFEVIAREALDAGVGQTATIGSAPSHLFEAEKLVTFAVAWMETRFASP